MSGEQDRGGSRPGQKPFFDEPEGPRPAPRARKVKPPPSVITAGGVDMARAHASGIRVRNNTGPATPTDEPRVVLAVPADPRKVPTHRRLLGGRASTADGSRPAVLPEASEEPTLLSPARANRPAGESRGLPIWARALLVVAVLAVAAGISERVVSRIVPPPVAAIPAEAPAYLPADHGHHGWDPIAPAAPPSAPAPPPTPTAESAAAPSPPPPPPPQPARKITTASAARAQPARAAPSKPEFTPPFELPGNKK